MNNNKSPSIERVIVNLIECSWRMMTLLVKTIRSINENEFFIKSLNLIAISYFLVFANGCAYNLKQGRTLEVIAAQNLNPDSKGKPLSVVVQIYHLNNLPNPPVEDWNDSILYDEPYKLKVDFIQHHQESIILPGQRLAVEIPPLEQSKFILLTAHFRQRDIQRWRILIDPSKAKNQSLYVLEQCGWRIAGSGVIRLHQQPIGKSYEDNIRAADIVSEPCTLNANTSSLIDGSSNSNPSTKRSGIRGLK